MRVSATSVVVWRLRECENDISWFQHPRQATEEGGDAVVVGWETVGAMLRLGRSYCLGSPGRQAGQGSSCFVALPACALLVCLDFSLVWRRRMRGVEMGHVWGSTSSICPSCPCVQDNCSCKKHGATEGEDNMPLNLNAGSTRACSIEKKKVYCVGCSRWVALPSTPRNVQRYCTVYSSDKRQESKHHHVPCRSLHASPLIDAQQQSFNGSHSLITKPGRGWRHFWCEVGDDEEGVTMMKEATQPRRCKKLHCVVADVFKVRKNSCATYHPASLLYRWRLCIQRTIGSLRST